MNETPDVAKVFSQLTSGMGANVSELFTKLKNSAISEQFQSWIGTGENRPVTADQIAEALGPDTMNKIAAKTGTTPEQAAQDVAQKLPALVDRATPDGRLPDLQAVQTGRPGAVSQPSGIRADISSATGPAKHKVAGAAKQKVGSKQKVAGAAGAPREAVPSAMPASGKPRQS